MTCREIRPLLEDFVDGDLAAEDRDAVVRHLDGCAACHDVAQSLFALAADARETLGPVEPARDLWPGIAGHIESARRFERRGRARTAWWIAAAAALGAVVGALFVRQGAETPSAVALSQPGQATLDVALAGWERDVLDQKNELLTSLEAQRDRLPAESIQAVEENLRLIDEAIGEIRSALERDPDNPKLNFLLADAYQQEVHLLKRLGRV